MLLLGLVAHHVAGGSSLSTAAFMYRRTFKPRLSSFTPRLYNNVTEHASRSSRLQSIMASTIRTQARSTSGPLKTKLIGKELLQDPILNKGSAFSEDERKELRLVGLLPSHVNTLEDQVQRAYSQYQTHRTAIGRNAFMTSMKEQNVVLYYSLLEKHLKEMFSIIYTPTEGDAIADYSHLFRRSEGCFLNIEKPENIEASLQQYSPEDVDIIVCSDGEQILGIGDQGVGAVLISVAKLVLYTLCAGIHPNRTLPVVLDVGTDNHMLRNDELYLGLQRPRVQGEEYDRFIGRFLNACRKRFPDAYIHFEDFGLHNARRILDKYSSQFACFNDDIQGTGCVTLAAITTAVTLAKDTQMRDLRVVIYGAGTAGIGIADQIRSALAVEGNKSQEEASRQIWCVDKQGLVMESDPTISLAQQSYARKDEERPSNGSSLLDVIRSVKPHVLIGTSTKPKSFTQEIVTEMAKHVKRPIIFPLSNPTRLHEAEPKDLIAWTDGRVLTATGSPFPPVEFNGETHVISECNNSMIFPGIGLGAILCRAKLMTCEMLVAAIKALASEAPALKSGDENAGLLPDVVDVREISISIAAAVIQQAVEDGLAREEVPSNSTELKQWISEQMWRAEYRPLLTA